jgi:RHS repeat-associated protein
VVNYEYDDFGETQIKESEVVQNELMYTGAVYDRGPRQYYLNARYYQPEKGNFLTQGTYRGEQTEPKTWNLYGYCAGNPINYTDPTGHGAMWLQQRDGARYAGHTAVSIHIGDSTWHYFSAEPVSQSFPEIVTGVKMNIVYRKTSIPPSRWKKNQKMSRVLSSKHGGVKYTEAHYFTGNFRNSYNLMSTLRTQKNLTYKLGSSNCKHMAILALKQGKNLKHPAVFNTLMHLASVQAVPNFAFQIIKRYKDS